MAELGLAEHHAGDKRAEGEGQAEEMGAVADPHGQCDHGHEEQFARTPAGDDPQQSRHDSRADDDHQGVLDEVAKGRADAKAGRTMTHAEVAKQLRSKWQRSAEG